MRLFVVQTVCGRLGNMHMCTKFLLMVSRAHRIRGRSVENVLNHRNPYSFSSIA